MFKFKDCKFYLVNLDKDTDRLKKSKQELNKINITDFERFSAVSVSNEEVENLSIFPKKFKNLGQIGCFLSHYNILKQNKNSKKNVCIFEDDIEFCDDFNERMLYIENNLSFEDWDILFLSSYYHLNSNPVWSNPEYEETKVKYIHRTYSSFCTHSYIVNKKSINKILDFLENNQENFFAIDHAYIEFQKINKCFSFTPGCVNQRPDISNIYNTSFNQYEYFSKNCGQHIFHKEPINTFKYYSYFFDDLYKHIKIRQKTFHNSFGSYTLNLEEYIFSDYGEPDRDGGEISEYKNIGDFCLNLEKDSYVIDVGANYGFSAFAAASRGYNVIAFEPVNINYYLLNKSIEEESNIFSEKIKTFKFALGDKTGKDKIYIPCFRDNCSMSKESAITNMKKSKDVTEEEIDIITFDDWLLRNKDFDEKKIKFIKSDTQGFEYSVVVGMTNFFKRNKDFYILLEWDPKMLENAGYSSESLYTFMIESGFVEKQWFTATGDKLFYKGQ